MGEQAGELLRIDPGGNEEDGLQGEEDKEGNFSLWDLVVYNGDSM